LQAKTATSRCFAVTELIESDERLNAIIFAAEVWNYSGCASFV